jgi:hypothetical protein
MAVQITIHPLKDHPKAVVEPKQISKLLDLVNSILEQDISSLQINFEYLYRNHSKMQKQDVLEVSEKWISKFNFQSLEQMIAEYRRFQDKLILLSNLMHFEELNQNIVDIYKQRFMKQFDISLLLDKIFLYRESLMLNGNLLINSELDTMHTDGDSVLNAILAGVEVYQDLNIYFLSFEQFFIQSSIAYYKEKFELCKKEPPASIINFLKQIIDREYANPFVPSITQTLLVKGIYSDIVAANISIILEKCFAEVIENNEHLHTIHTLCQKTNCLPNLLGHLDRYIISQEFSEGKLIQELLLLSSQLSNFKAIDKIYSDQIKQSFSKIVNEEKNKSSELIAYHIDKLMKHKGDEEMIEEQLEEALALFRLVHGKDIFEAFYGKTLAKRLLLEKSASVDAEKSMLFKLKSGMATKF